MQKKWGYASSIAALIGALFTTIFILADITSLSIVFGILTIAFSAICVAVTYLMREIPQIRNTRSADTTTTLKPSEKHTESISRAVDQEKNSNIDAGVEERANTESATIATKDTIDDTHHDEESGLLSASFFPVYLDQRITAARRTLRPVSLVIFELDGLDKNDSHSPSDRNFYISAVGDVVKRTLRESDCAFRIDDNIFAAAMDDTTESGAVWAAERVRGVLHTGALAGRVTVSAGVACYPSHALETQDLIDCANKALAAAKDRGVDQVEIAAETSAD